MARSSSSDPGPRGRLKRPSPRPLGVLHPLASLLAHGQARGDRDSNGAAQRRRRQRLALAQRLLDPLPTGLRSPQGRADRFWTVLRWGGLGLIIARLLLR